MLAPKQLPEAYRRWNIEHGAPHGRSLPLPDQIMRSELAAAIAVSSCATGDRVGP